MSKSFAELPYNPHNLPRELKQFYISASNDEIKSMLKELGLSSLEQLYEHIPEEIKFKEDVGIGPGLSYQELIEHISSIGAKNHLASSFIGDGLKNFKESEIVKYVSNIRELTTAYTPYQPERSQGTLQTLWLYAQTLSKLTGFEAINSSMYDRATCLFEALNSAIKIVRNSDSVIVCESIYPGDMSVLKTMATECKINIVTVPVDSKTGTTSLSTLKDAAKSLGPRLAAIAFPQVNALGNLEDVNAIVDLTSEFKTCSIAIVDPMLLATGGLIPPSQFGSNKQGATILVAEGQHLAIGPNFGGPGLGIFGIRYDDKNKNNIRTTPGRYVGKGKDNTGKTALSIILSTREQHIRREKATSNICSNEAFIASLAGASILQKGETGMQKSCITARKNCEWVATHLLQFAGVKLAYPETPFFNEFTIELPCSTATFIQKGRLAGLHVGVDVSKRDNTKRNLLMICVTDIQEETDFKKLFSFFTSEFGDPKTAASEIPHGPYKFNRTANMINNPVYTYDKPHIPSIPSALLRQGPVGLPHFSLDELKRFYDKLGAQNVSPDSNIYPLGSCTMKYNPYVNDYLAGLSNFTQTHPQAPIEDVQGNLEILYNIQEMFKKITGLAAVTTQPVAGAHGELTGIKLFQAYHRNNGEDKQRNVIIIPHSAHGTNPATATVAGLETKCVDGINYGIVLVEAGANGQIDLTQLKKLVSEYNKRIVGVMITNPNTSGIFETKFKEIADLIHSVGGLVYMDGANMNAIAGWVNMGKMGVDAIHNNLHKTWSISHGGGGPGDAIVAVSSKLIDFLPGIQVVKKGNLFTTEIPQKSIGQMHRHFGNFAHKIRGLSYLKALGDQGIRQMSAVAVLSARYLEKKLKNIYSFLPANTNNEIRMHEFIITLAEELFAKIEKSGTAKAQVIAKVGKLFLDYGLHAPTVAFPEVFGLMIEPTESYTKAELDRFIDILTEMHYLLNENPEVLKTVPHFTPIGKVDEVDANKNVLLSEALTSLPEVYPNKITPTELAQMSVRDITKKIVEAHKKAM